MSEALAPQGEVPVAVPDAGAFALALVPNGSRPRSLRRLHDRLSRVDPREADLFVREDALVGLAKWIRVGGEVPTMEGAPPLERGPIRRIRVLVRALGMFPAYRERLSRLIQSLLAEQSAQSFFARMGIPGDRGLFTETIDRLSRRLMPQPIDEQDVTQVVARMFPSRADAAWLGEIPAELAEELLRLLKSPVDLGRGSNTDERGSSHDGPRSTLGSRGDLPLGAMPSMPDRMSIPPTNKSFSVFAPLTAAVLEAILLLASRVSSAGLSDVIRARSPQLKHLHDSPFFRLPRSIDMLLATPRHDAEEIALWAEECQTLVNECRDASRAVLTQLEAAGVSTDVVYRLELIERSLRRIELLVGAIVPGSRFERAKRAIDLLAVLLEERRRDLSLTDIVRTNTRMLARKVIERAGNTGEHYITITAGDYFKMFLSAAGGGVLTAGTAVLKTFIGHLHRPPLQEGLLASANYAGSFMAMQLLGFTLATKQPSMTAAALAGALKGGTQNKEEVVTILARLVRSQVAAAAGNVLMVIPASIAVDRLWSHTHAGEHFLERAYAEKTIHSFHPTESGTIAFAALTGVILWLSSLAAGWLENWAVYRRLPEAIAEHRIRRYVGARVTTWASRVFARNIAGLGGNVAVGFMLGMTPILAQFAGLPLEVRHVTLSTGSLTMAVMALGSESLSSPAFSAACLGIFIILLENLLVSFAFALSLALRAREVTIFKAIGLVFAIVAGFFKSPLRFFFPVEKVEPGKVVGHGH